MKNIIRHERERLDITQADLAKAVGVAKQTVCDWEKGRSSPGKYRLLRLPYILGIPIDYLLQQEADRSTA